MANNSIIFMRCSLYFPSQLFILKNLPARWKLMRITFLRNSSWGALVCFIKRCNDSSFHIDLLIGLPVIIYVNVNLSSFLRHCFLPIIASYMAQQNLYTNTSHLCYVSIMPYFDYIKPFIWFIVESLISQSLLCFYTAATLVVLSFTRLFLNAAFFVTYFKNF